MFLRLVNLLNANTRLIHRTILIAALHTPLASVAQTTNAEVFLQTPAFLKDRIAEYEVQSKNMPPHLRHAIFASETGPWHGPGLFSNDLLKSASYFLLSEFSVPKQKHQNTLRFKLMTELNAFASEDALLFIIAEHGYFGRTAIGIEAAAQAYFAKSTKELQLSEIAYLAGVLKAPTRYGAEPHATQRRDYVLDLMEWNGHLTPEQKATAQSDVLQLRDFP